MVVPVGQSDTVQSLIKVTRTATGFDYEELRQCVLSLWSKALVRVG